ncbi:hypothetical protein [Erythrobacter sp. JK5]|uniref:hypothetical protein n=1 Tax=Erythrobacter sp. JK5 TaxID=2829500 RepID=UPI001BA74114|nr:hypothetical protein [Erythrobacter sp. JK5]QUL39088.1 hypothetical protein KDC96_07085 [Erythrobacter sp. JK5]
MKATRRTAMFGSLAAASGLAGASQALTGCAPGSDPADVALTKVTVLAVLHGNHRTSEAYSLDRLRTAIRRAEPDVILTEIPPDRIDEARRSFAETGEVTEPRTRVFPEYTDVVFPLSREMDFTLVGTAGWTQQIADDRSAALRAIESDRDRASQWAEHLEARAELSRALDGRGDDPRFIHSPEYDVLVQRGQTPYQIYFDPDLGAGGWTKINAAHTGLINAALDTIGGQSLRALVMFGGWHKYMIERSLAFRGDIERQDAQSLFD